jgi:glycosidase
MPGAPYLYYGEEIGMLGLKPDENIREPFLWDVKEKDTGRTGWMEPVYTTDATVTPLAIQKEDPNSYFNHYRSLIALRNSYPALAIGDLELPIATYPKAVMAYNRNSGDQAIFVIHNLGKTEIVVDAPDGFNTKLYTLGETAHAEGKVKLGKNSSIVLMK